jgi:hypothetical protein
MSNDGIRIVIGTRVLFDGQLWEVSELLPAAKGTEVVLSAYGRHSEVVRISLREVLEGRRVRLCGEGTGPNSHDLVDPADVVLSAMTDDERDAIRQRASHIREILTGFRSGSADFAEPGEPRNEYAPGRSLIARYAAKALELDQGRAGSTLFRFLAFRYGAEPISTSGSHTLRLSAGAISQWERSESVS